MEKWERAATLILTTLLLASLILNLNQRNSVIELSQRYQELAIEHDSKTMKLNQLRSTLNETEETLKQLNKTFTTLETIPMVKAANMIISQVGLSYFNQYFHDPRVQTPGLRPQHYDSHIQLRHTGRKLLNTKNRILPVLPEVRFSLRHTR